MNYNVSILYITESRAGPPPFEKNYPTPKTLILLLQVLDHIL